MKFYYHGTLIYKNTKLPKLFSYYKCYTLNPHLLFQNKTTFLSLTYKRANLQLLFFCPYCKILSKAFDLSYRGVWVFRLLHVQHVFRLLPSKPEPGHIFWRLPTDAQWWNPWHLECDRQWFWLFNALDLPPTYDSIVPLVAHNHFARTIYKAECLRLSFHQVNRMNTI